MCFVWGRQNEKEKFFWSLPSHSMAHYGWMLPVAGRRGEGYCFQFGNSCERFKSLVFAWIQDSSPPSCPGRQHNLKHRHASIPIRKSTSVLTLQFWIARFVGEDSCGMQINVVLYRNICWGDGMAGKIPLCSKQQKDYISFAQQEDSPRPVFPW